MSNNSYVVDNGLTVSIDWLSFTVTDLNSVGAVIEFMGFDSGCFRDMPNGANGYKRMKKYDNINILYDGANGMGIHVNVSGSSVNTLLESFKETLSVVTPFGKAYDLWDETVTTRFLQEVLKIGHFTRIDLAIDDIGGNYYTLAELSEKLEEGLVISRWRTYRSLVESGIFGNDKVGHTIYFGSSQSDIMMRVYDKQLEQNKGLEPDSDRYIDTAWVRWELELHKKRADKFVDVLVSGIPFGEAVIGVLYNYFRIIQNDDCNKSRCSLDVKWKKFVCNVRKLRITIRKEEKTLDEQAYQFERQNGRKMALLFCYKGGDLEYFGDIAYKYRNKLTAKQLEQLEREGCL